jgi:hypothetical protein
MSRGTTARTVSRCVKAIREVRAERVAVNAAVRQRIARAGTFE